MESMHIGTREPAGPQDEAKKIRYGLMKARIGTEHQVSYRDDKGKIVRLGALTVRSFAREWKRSTDAVDAGKRKAPIATQAICLKCKQLYPDMASLLAAHDDNDALVKAMEVHTVALWCGETADSNPVAAAWAAAMPTVLTNESNGLPAGYHVKIGDVPIGLLSDENL